MGDFRPLRESELDRLDSEALVDYIVAAREAGASAAERTAVGLLAFAFEDTIRAWVWKDMASAARDVDDVTMEVIASAVRSAFDGKVVGEFGSFLRTITKRRVVDYFRRRERRPEQDPLPSEHASEEDVWGEEPADDDETDLLALREAVARVLATRNPMHRRVIRLYGPNVAGFMDLSAEEVKAQIDGGESDDSVSVDNVAKIWSRFKRDLEAELDG